MRGRGSDSLCPTLITDTQIVDKLIYLLYARATYLNEYLSKLLPILRIPLDKPRSDSSKNAEQGWQNDLVGEFSGAVLLVPKKHMMEKENPVF